MRVLPVGAILVLALPACGSGSTEPSTAIFASGQSPTKKSPTLSAAAVHPAASTRRAASPSPVSSSPESLKTLASLVGAGLDGAEVRRIDVPTPTFTVGPYLLVEMTSMSEARDIAKGDPAHQVSCKRYVFNWDDDVGAASRQHAVTVFLRAAGCSS